MTTTAAPTPLGYAPSAPVPRETLHRLWRELVDLPFPDGLAGIVVDGVDLARLDSDAGRLIARLLEGVQRPRAANLAVQDADAEALAACHRTMLRAEAIDMDSGALEYMRTLARVTRHVLEALGR